MKALNKQATRIFNRILEQLGAREYVQIANSDVFMPLNVDRLDKFRIALAHNGVQNGDAMADPDMTFWISPEGQIFPCTFQNDYLGLYQEAVQFAGDMPKGFRPRLQASITSFANQWMQNIADQQGI